MSFFAERKRANKTQEEVAAQLRVSKAAISQWENGQTNPRTSILPKLAAIYGCTVDDLLKEDDA